MDADLLDRTGDVLHGTEDRTRYAHGFGRFCHAEDLFVDGVVAAKTSAIDCLCDFLGRRNQFGEGFARQVFFPVEGDELIFNPVAGIDGRNADLGRSS